ncbi:transcriptional regulator [Paraburkholderia phenazinium]|jgi:predicted transcriptional regulator|uniref:Predicted transcriptional regulator, contains an HTH and PUA-like domains n=1 Tax=Paraburkholderia phenazinium TaxID=60549 RepID=A0A1G8MBA9_9BURK|nr:transcriptional regulator [Paraburkholderia phenazinium]SDI65155.1 Predicted transcriptional regulator, contains an HTH and PUA-like domains [Paraburkholderia phenazinium]
MDETEHVLISLEERHAENIFAGKKHVELRRRAMNVKAGTVVWIYVKLPVGRVVGYARVSAAHSLAPSTLWKRFADVCCITRSEFFAYFEGLSKGFALSLQDPERLPGAVSLVELREASAGFHPPQFFVRLAPDSPLLHAIEERRGVHAPPFS